MLEDLTPPNNSIGYDLAEINIAKLLAPDRRSANRRLRERS